nr:hypothetical protein [uncultured Methanomethylovorans sp.]
MAFTAAVSAQESSKISDKPSELEQGLIDALNSNTKSFSTDDLITNYFKANKDKIPTPNKDTLDDTSLRTYELKDGSDVTFTNQGFFFITSTKKELNNKKEIQNTATTSLVASMSALQYTPTITASQSFYSLIGTRLFTIYSKGYYGFNVNPAIVETHYTDAWYSLGTPSIFQVSNWKEGGINYLNTHTGEIYGSGHFHWGIEIQGVGLVLYDKYIKVYSTCDQFGNVHRKYEMQ